MNVAMLPCIKWLVTTAPPGPSECGIPCQCLIARGGILTATAPNTPVALPVGSNNQVILADSACSTGLKWGSALPSGCSTGQAVCINTACPLGIQSTDVGKTHSEVVGTAQAVCMDNLKVDWSNVSGSRNLRFGTVSGTALADIQAHYAQASVVSACLITDRALTTTVAPVIGWNFTSTAACVTYMVGINDSNSDYVCAYNVTGIVGDGFRCNIICITRII